MDNPRQHVVIRRFNVWSAFKVGFTVQLVLNFTVGLLGYLLLATNLFRFADFGIGYGSRGLSGIATSFSVISCLYLFLIALGAGIGWAIVAFVYNLTSDLTGGIEADIDMTPRNRI